MSEPDWTWVYPDGPEVQKVPKWKRSAGLAPDGVIYAPAAIAGNELAVTMAAQWDGVASVLHSRHVYLPTSWLRQEYPDIADVFDLIEKRVKEHAYKKD
jgi:hypothetical protein